MFNLGPNTGFKVLGFQLNFVDARMLLQLFDLAGYFSSMPVGLYIRKLFTILRTTIATVCEDKVFLAVKKVYGLVEIMLIGGGSCETVRQPSPGINTDMGFHTEVPLISFLSLVHLRITFTSFVLGRTGGFDDRRIQQCSFFYQYASFAQP